MYLTLSAGLNIHTPMLQSNKEFVKRSKHFPSAGCKESHFYSLPFGQAEANIYKPKHHSNYPEKRFDEQIDFTVPL